MILITGASGFIGSALVRRLAKKKTEIIAAWRNTPYELNGESGVVPVRLDIARRSDFDALRWADISAVIHLAATLPSPEGVPAVRYLRDNIVGTENVVDFCREKGIGTFVFASSVGVYGRSGVLREGDAPAPSDDYASSKLVAERVCAKFSEAGSRVVILRMSAVYGPGMRAAYVLPVFVRQALQGEDLVVYGGGASAMDYLYVDDAARAFEVALEENASGLFNACSGEATSLWDLANLVREIFGDDSTGVLRDESKPCAGRQMSPSPEKAARELGFAASITLRKGLARWKKSLNPAAVSLEEKL